MGHTIDGDNAHGWWIPWLVDSQLPLRTQLRAVVTYVRSSATTFADKNILCLQRVHEHKAEAGCGMMRCKFADISRHQNHIRMSGRHLGFSTPTFQWVMSNPAPMRNQVRNTCRVGHDKRQQQKRLDHKTKVPPRIDLLHPTASCQEHVVALSNESLLHANPHPRKDACGETNYLQEVNDAVKT